MSSFKRILVVADATPDWTVALAEASELSEPGAVPVTVLDTVNALPPAALAVAKKIGNEALQEQFVEQRREQLQQRLATAGLGDSQVTLKVAVGTPFLEIIFEVLRGDYDLVIKVADGYQGVSSALFGSTDMHLLRKCPCPVWITKAGGVKDRTNGSILAAVDPDPNDPQRDALNNAILRYGYQLAARRNAELLVLHAWDFAGEQLLRSLRSPLSKAEVNRLVSAVYSEHANGFEQLLGRAASENDPADVRLDPRLVRGQPERLIPAAAAEYGVQLLIMGTVGRTGVAGFFIGNTAETVLERIDCPVLALKPPGFETPVRLDTQQG